MRISKTVWLLGILVFAAEIAFGYWMAHVNHFVAVDAFSRVANAYYVGYSRDPHLAAIGFVWNPLPSLLMLPILVAQPLYPALASSAIAGVILSGFFTSATVVMLCHHFIKRGMPLLFSLLICLLYGLNPFIFLYGSNGMSESVFIFFLVWIVITVADWLEKGKINSLIGASFALALAFLTRYEAVAFGACLALGFILLIWKQYKQNPHKSKYRELYNKIEATEIVLLTPAFFTGILWIFLNYSIMGDPLYFLRSSYSNLGQAAQLVNNATFSPLMGHPVEAALYISERIACFLPPLGLIIVMRLWRRSLFKTEFAVILLLIASIPAMQFLMLIKGSSYGWLRFFVYPLPLVMAWLPYELQKQKQSRGYRTSCLMALAVLVGCGIFTWNVMQNKSLSPEEYDAIHYQQSKALPLAMEIAADLDRRAEQNDRQKVLMDAFNAFYVILNSKRPYNLVITSDRDFEQSLRHPEQYNITHILVPDPNGIASLNAVNQRYPGFYDHGASWAALEKDYGGGWKLYRVIPQSETEDKRLLSP
ncbi:glycosyltransferase family 39 protein [Paenibacillus piri]|nr:glycosyltransferase family 39 protein [Paenibacillus piri]